MKLIASLLILALSSAIADASTLPKPFVSSFCPQNCPQPTCNPWTQDCSKSGGCGGLDCFVN